MSASSLAVRPVSLAGWMSGHLNRLVDACQQLLTPSPNTLRDAEQVLALAEQVESTQPSWAADLRAVAMHMEAARNHGRSRD